MTLSASHEAFVADSIDMILSLSAVKENFRKTRDLFFLSFWTNIRKRMKSYYKYFDNFISFATQHGSRCKYQINDYRGIFRTQSNSYDGFFDENSQGLKAVEYYCKKLHRRSSTEF